eukprot:756447-Hanusia_phi.AAC.5
MHRQPEGADLSLWRLLRGDCNMPTWTRSGGEKTRGGGGGGGDWGQVSELIHSMAKDVRLTYAIAGTQKFEIPTDQLSLSKVGAGD